MNQMMRAFHVDKLKLFGTGWVKPACDLLLPMAFVLVLGGIEHIGFWTLTAVETGLMATATVMMSSMLFSFEDMGEVRRLSGVLTAGRIRQVDGRYLLMGVINLATAVDVLVTVLLISLLTSHEFAPYGWIAAGVCLLFCTLADAVILPFMYRFPTQKAMSVLVVTFFAVIVAVAGLVKLIPHSLKDAVAGWFSSYIFVSVWIGVPIVIMVAVVCAGASALVSRRIYSGRQI